MRRIEQQSEPRFLRWIARQQPVIFTSVRTDSARWGLSNSEDKAKCSGFTAGGYGSVCLRLDQR